MQISQLFSPSTRNLGKNVSIKERAQNQALLLRVPIERRLFALRLGGSHRHYRHAQIDSERVDVAET